MLRVNQAVESRKSVRDIGHVKVLAFCKPGGEEVFVCNKVSKLTAAIIYRVCVLLRQLLEILCLPAVPTQELFLLIGEKFIEDKAENVVLILVRLNF